LDNELLLRFITDWERLTGDDGTIIELFDVDDDNDDDDDDGKFNDLLLFEIA
jgi:hypothetical protein